MPAFSCQALHNMQFYHLAFIIIDLLLAKRIDKNHAKAPRAAGRSPGSARARFTEFSA